MSAVEPILPRVTDLNRPFWDGCREGELRLQRCSDCGHLRHPISAICPRCLSTAYAWEALSGHGTVFSWVLFQQGYHPWWRERLPYPVAMIELREGPHLFSSILGVAPAEIEVGAEVTVDFCERADGLFVPAFRLMA